MTLQEFNYEFDIAWDNIMSNQAPSLTSYEKSVFLTQAQETYVKTVYDKFETDEKTREMLLPLVKQLEMIYVSTGKHIVKNSKLYRLPDDKEEDVLYIIYEWIVDTKHCNREIIVKPIKHDDFWNVYNNPFKGANGNRALRISNYDDRRIYELISKYDIKQYFIRYVSRPNPIIIGDSDAQGLTINGIDATIDSECEIPEIYHRDILQLAVEEARSAWITQQR